MLSTYPPNACGLAMFSAALERALRSIGLDVQMVQVSDGLDESDHRRRVAGVLINGSPPSVRHAGYLLSRADVAVVHHEFGLYGGQDGDEMLDVLRLVDSPVITVLHAVPSSPSAGQRRVLEDASRHSSRVVVLTVCARERLLANYRVDPCSVVTIPHGAIVATQPLGGLTALHPSQPQLLSWGLIRPGKGIEQVIDAVATLNDAGVRLHYTVAGMTHPKVAAVNGEAYRNSLTRRAQDAGVRDLVRLDPKYRGPDHLALFLSTSSVIVMPYASTDQATSGVLVDSIAAGRPVIATAFPHAVELLSDGAGILVDHGDQAGLVAAIQAATSDPVLHDSMAAAARRLAPLHSWETISQRYADLAARVVCERRSVSA
jgi:polysaccharide biosynthesis protein PslF